MLDEKQIIELTKHFEDLNIPANSEGSMWISDHKTQVREEALLLHRLKTLIYPNNEDEKNMKRFRVVIDYDPSFPVLLTRKVNY